MTFIDPESSASAKPPCSPCSSNSAKHCKNLLTCRRISKLGWTGCTRGRRAEGPPLPWGAGASTVERWGQPAGGAGTPGGWSTARGEGGRAHADPAGSGHRSSSRGMQLSVRLGQNRFSHKLFCQNQFCQNRLSHYFTKC